MVIQSRWLVNEKETRSKKRDIALKPRLDYATELVDTMLQILTQKRFNLDKNNAHLYAQIKESKYISNEFQKQLRIELEISRVVESLRQVRRCLDSVYVLGNILSVLTPSISIIRRARSQLYELIPETDIPLGELAVLLGSLIIDTAHLTNAIVDFEKANRQSEDLLAEAKLIADSKIYKQFPNVDFL